jgi:hypothetical protein
MQDWPSVGVHAITTDGVRSMSLYKRPDSPYHYMRFVVAGTAVNRSTGTEDRDAAQEVEDRERALLHRQKNSATVAPLSLVRSRSDG